MGVIILGAGVTGLMFYAIFRELFSSKSPNGVYSAALDKCMKDYRIEDSLGAPIKAYGEETRRGRRGHVAHTSYIKDGIPHMQMMFHLQGIRNRAQVRLEVKENESGNWEYRYLFAQLEDYPRTTIILEDNRLPKSITDSSLGLS
ncbi:mitochondrial import inner membrane translocase subunit Tim21 isoform X2 [Ctenocephalides felis]|nr:mitochondrial import inner membrane translocase subunit Tim21 isoform X2 [Ctenocephalides felis]